MGLLRASSAHSNGDATTNVTLSTRRSSSKLSAALLVKRVRDVKNEPGGKHGCDKTSEQGQKGREQERVGRFGEAWRKGVRARARQLHGEVVKLQLWVVDKGLKVVVVFEGGGKGGVIEAITERVSPRVFRVVALPALAKRENTRIYAPPGPALFPVSVLHAHKGIVDRGRLIKPMARIAVCGLAARRPAVRIEGELVMPHRHYVTLRAFWLDGRVGRRLRGRRNR